MRHSIMAGQFLVSLLFCGASLWPLTVAAGDDKKNVESEEPVIDVDPEGSPPGVDKPVDGPTYFLWREGDVWHLRTRTVKLSRAFAGSIQVQGGRVTKIGNFSGLEARGPKRDIGRLNDAKNRIDFRFVTTGREDGFDFKLSKGAKSLRFDLKIDGYEHRDRVRIGRKGQGPPNAIFSLPALAPEETGESAGAGRK